MLWSGIHAALEERPVVQGEIDGEADGRDGKDRDKEPALPVIPRARGQENEGDEYGHPRDPLRDGLLVERIHRCMNGTPAVQPRNARLCIGQRGHDFAERRTGPQNIHGRPAV